MNKVAVTAPSKVVVKVKSTKLVFRNVGDKLRYAAIGAKKIRNQAASARYEFGSIAWRNAKHK